VKDAFTSDSPGVGVLPRVKRWIGGETEQGGVSTKNSTHGGRPYLKLKFKGGKEKEAGKRLFGGWGVKKSVSGTLTKGCKNSPCVGRKARLL